MTLKFENPEIQSFADLEEAIKERRFADAESALIAISLESTDRRRIEMFCSSLLLGTQKLLRRVSILALAHVGRRFGVLKKTTHVLVNSFSSDLTLLSTIEDFNDDCEVFVSTLEE